MARSASTRTESPSNQSIAVPTQNVAESAWAKPNRKPVSVPMPAYSATACAATPASSTRDPASLSAASAGEGSVASAVETPGRPERNHASM